MMKKVLFSLLLVAAPLASVSAANPVDNYASRAIAVADYAQAEAQLQARLRRAPADQPALLNLAYVLRHTARRTDANALCAQVLSRVDVRLVALDGTTVSAHELARRCLSGTVSVAMR